jgi:hypothetical protein
MIKNRLLIFGGMLFFGHLSAQTLVYPDQGLRSADPKLRRTEIYQAYGVKNPMDSTAYLRTTYDYPSPTERIDVNFQYDGEVWVPQGRFRYIFDALQRITVFNSETYNASTKQFVPQARQQAYPHGNTQQNDSLLSYNWSLTENKYVLTLKQTNAFNSKDQVKEVSTIISISGQVFRTKEVYSYDSNNNVIRTENFTYLGEVATKSSFTKNTYTNKLLSTSTTYTAIGITDSIPQAQTTNRYNGLGLLEQTESFRWDFVSMTWGKLSSTIYGYDAAKRILFRETSVVNTGQPDQRSRAEFFYNKDGSAKYDVNYTFDTNAQAFKLDNKRFYFYDPVSSLRDLPTSFKPLILYPNPTRGSLYLKLQDKAQVQVFGSNGQMLQAVVLNPGQVLDLSSLPAGMYQVLAKEGTEFFGSKVFKQ